jgi:hypothetical protein
MMKLLSLFSISLISFSLFAGEDRTMGRSPHGLLMGDAYTTLADDEFSLFYNPALLGRNKGFTFTPLNVSVTGVNIIQDQDKIDSLSSGDPETITDAILGFPIHVGFSYAPGFKMGRFGLSVINNSQTNLSLQNKVSPTLKIDHRYDRGFVMGYGMPMFGEYSKESGGRQLSLGFSVKYVKRQSIDDSFYLYGTSLLNAISKTEIADILAELGMVNGQGWGTDVGLDYVATSGNQTLALGLSVMDLITTLNTDKNILDKEVQAQPAQVSFGSSLRTDMGPGFHFTMSADIKHLEQDIELMRRVYLGAELGISPALSLLAGVNAVDNYSYGIKINTGIIKAYLGVFGTEIGEQLNQEESNRFVVYVNLFSFNFNP